MENIVKFLDNFFEEERKMLTYRRILNLDRYNAQVKTVQEFLYPDLHESIGDVEMRFKGPNSLYTMTDEDPLRDPRTLFKISKYSHSKYDRVWIAYTNAPQSDKDSLFLTYALFIIEQEGKLRIANIAMYSDYDSDGLEYKWDNIAGKEGLSFDSLGQPDEILRIRKPFEDFDGLKLYNEDK